MKYRTKLYLFLIGISTTTLVIALSSVIYQSKKAVFTDLQSQAMSIASSAAANLNGDLVEEIKVKEDQKKPAYTEVQTYLRKVRNANRNEHIQVKFIYTVYPDPSNPKQFLFGVDAEELEKDFSPAGTVDDGAEKDKLTDNLTEVYSPPHLVSDEWGRWLTGYAPIFNSKGAYIGSIGVDISAKFVGKMEDRLYTYGITALFLTLALSIISAWFLARKATGAIQSLEQATKEISKGNFAHRVDIKTGDEFQDLGNSMNKMCQGLEEKERLKTGFAHYVSQHVMDNILAEGAPKLGGERRKITVFFCDIRDFTKISEKLPPEEVMAILNEYFQAMLDIVFKHNGMLDKLIGDAIMAEFGYPAHDAEQEKNAVLTALEMQHALTLLRDKWRREGKPQIEIGVGIHTGEAIVGTLGSKDRMEFTAIGDTVNVASRLESATRTFNEQIIISEATFLALKNEFQAKPLGEIELKGKDIKINAYAIQTLK